jgi:hypothetical protein
MHHPPAVVLQNPFASSKQEVRRVPLCNTTDQEHELPTTPKQVQLLAWLVDRYMPLCPSGLTSVADTTRCMLFAKLQLGGRRIIPGCTHHPTSIRSSLSAHCLGPVACPSVVRGRIIIMNTHCLGPDTYQGHHTTTTTPSRTLHFLFT